MEYNNRFEESHMKQVLINQKNTSRLKSCNLILVEGTSSLG